MSSVQAPGWNRTISLPYEMPSPAAAVDDDAKATAAAISSGFIMMVQYQPASHLTTKIGKKEATREMSFMVWLRNEQKINKLHPWKMNVQFLRIYFVGVAVAARHQRRAHTQEAGDFTGTNDAMSCPCGGRVGAVDHQQWCTTSRPDGEEKTEPHNHLSPLQPACTRYSYCMNTKTKFCPYTIRFALPKAGDQNRHPLRGNLCSGLCQRMCSFRKTPSIADKKRPGRSGGRMICEELCSRNEFLSCDDVEFMKF